MTITPTVIYTFADLVAAMQNDPSGYYVLGADIDASQLYFTSTIADFSGVLDGAGHSINGLKSFTGGLFDKIDTSGLVENVNFNNANIYALGIPVGTIAFENDGAILGCSVTGAVLGSSITGALVGYNLGSIGGSYSGAAVSGYNGTSLGGLVGLNGTTGIITNSYATGPVSGIGDVGGFVGANSGLIAGSYATGAVNGGGGFVGTNEGTGHISNSYATGSVTGGMVAVGGFGGANFGNIEGSYATGFLTETNNGFIPGGFIGFASDPSRALPQSYVSNSYWDVETSGTSYSPGGTGLTTAQLDSGILPTGFDPTIWFDTAGQFPELRWQVPFNTTPIIINSIGDLQAIQNNPAGYYVLGADIDASGFNFASIADFSGVLNGKGHSITGLTSGLFVKIDVDGLAENLNLSDVHISSVTGVGSIAFENDGAIVGCAAIGTVTGGAMTGALVGENLGTITRSYAAGTVTGTAYVGGLVGLNGPSGSITQSFATDTADGQLDIGGLVGLNGGTVAQSYATGEINPSGRSGLGIGGLVGISTGSITQSYAIGLIAGGGFAVGGLTGAGGATASYWDTETTGRAMSGGGTGLTTDQLESGTLPDGFDPTVWFDTAGQFPELNWQVSSNQPPTVSAAVQSTRSEDDASYTVDLLQFATDPDASDILHVANVAGLAAGATFIGDTLLVDPNAYNSLAVGEHATINISYKVVDGHGGSVPQAATITINGADDLPIATSDIATVQKGGTVTGNVKANDYDPDTHDALLLHVSAVNGDSTKVGTSIDGAYGKLTLNADGSFHYKANTNLGSAANTGAVDTFTYTVNGGHTEDDAIATLSIQVVKPNTPIPTGAHSPSLLEYYYAANVVYADNALGTQNGTAPPLQTGLMLLLDSRDPSLQGSSSWLSDGFFAQAFKDSFGNVIISFEGSIINPRNLADPNFWTPFAIGSRAADWAIAAGLIPQAFLDAESFALDVNHFLALNNLSSAPIYLTGHSLGGAEAQDVAYIIGDTNGVTFGSPGTPDLSTPVGASHFVNYVDYGDPVGQFGAHFGTTQQVGLPSDAIVETTLEALLGPDLGALSAAALYHPLQHYATALGLHPSVPIFEHEFLSNSGQVLLSGFTAEANDAIFIYDGPTLLGTTTTANDGGWSFATEPVSNTVHVYTAIGIDAGGNVGASINEAILGSQSSETLVGGTGNDLINGNGGNDTIVGGLGADTLTGGSDKDNFLYKTIFDSTPEHPDMITNFVHGADTIDLTNIAGVYGLGRNSAFQGDLGGSGNLALRPHSVGYVEVNGNTDVLVNPTNATEIITSSHVSAASMEIILPGIHLGLTSMDFHLA